MAQRSIANGFFISFEGGECSGKSTQAELLAAALRKQEYAVLETREPGGTAFGEELRRLLKYSRANADAPCPEAELFLFSASRSQLMRELILPQLERGGIVICDRFADSTTAYQGYARGLELELIRKLNQAAVIGRWPDLTLLLDLDPAHSRQRGQLRLETLHDQDRFEAEERAFHEKVRAGYLELAKEHPERITVLDAAAGRDELHQQILEITNHNLKSKI